MTQQFIPELIFTNIIYKWDQALLDKESYRVLKLRKYKNFLHKPCFLKQKSRIYILISTSYQLAQLTMV